MSRPEPEPTIVVTAAVIERDGSFLVTRRGKGVHLEGYWEFPGGKCEAGETHVECLARELREELDVVGEIGAKVLSVTHAYPERVVELHFYRCRLTMEPKAMLDQEIRWVGARELRLLPFPPADEELIALLGRE